MRKTIITIMLVAILISPIQASASKFPVTMGTQYEKALVGIINLLIDRIEQLMVEIKELKRQQATAPTTNSIQIQPKKVVEQPKPIVKKKIAPKPYVRPRSNYVPATPSSNRCHSGSIDIKKTDKNCK